MNISARGIQLIRSSEGFSQIPYLCPAGVPTIGYGTTRYASGVAVRMSDKPITKEQADGIMRSALYSYESAVNHYVRVPLTQGQFDALVSFVYNCGESNFKASTLLRMLNASEYQQAANQFRYWVYAGGRPVRGLMRRRERERIMFIGAEDNNMSTDAASNQSKDAGHV